MATPAQRILIVGVAAAVITCDGFVHAQEDAYRDYVAVVKARCEALGIAVPIRPVSTLNEFTRASVEHALEDAFARGPLFGDIKFGFRQDTLVVWVHYRPPTRLLWFTNPEAVEATLKAADTAARVPANLPTAIRRVIAEVFQTPPEIIDEAPPVDPRYALQALGIGVLWKLPTVSANGYLKINVLQTWTNVKEAVRNLGLAIDVETKPDPSTGRRTIQTVPMVIENAPLTESYYEISLWDPLFRRPAYGTGVRLNATLVVRRQRDSASEPDLMRRSGPRQQVVVDAVMKFASRR